MTETTVFLEVGLGKYHSRVERLPFASVGAALECLGHMQPKMGARYSNNPDKATHRVDSLAGAAVFVMEEVVSARVIDIAAYNEAVRPARDLERAQDEERFGLQAASLVNAARLLKAAEAAP